MAGLSCWRPKATTQIKFLLPLYQPTKNSGILGFSKHHTDKNKSRRETDLLKHCSPTPNPPKSHTKRKKVPATETGRGWGGRTEVNLGTIAVGNIYLRDGRCDTVWTETSTACNSVPKGEKTEKKKKTKQQNYSECLDSLWMLEIKPWLAACKARALHYLTCQ